VKRLRWSMILAAAAFVGAFALLVPASGIDTEPPECYSAIGFVVPCGSGFAAIGALTAALLVIGGSIAGHLETRKKQ
jgi:hypothetical protein